tara:strand:- start:222 stop:1181 length:960 start_codon:yes stop_codon:yes gene_type:complete
MEFVHSLKKSDRNNTDLYNQNTKTDPNCYFENRLTKPTSDVYIPTTKVQDSYSSKFSTPVTTDNLSPSSETIPNKINSHYKILIDGVTELNSSDLVNVSQSYDVKADEVNFSSKDYSDKAFTIDDSLLLSENKFQTQQSVTDNNRYKNPKFWTQQVPDAITNEYLVRDIPRYFYDKSVERFILPKDVDGNYNNSVMTQNYSEPKVSKNYQMNYTSENNLIIHGGKKKPNSMNSYKKNVGYSNGDDGMLVYYEDNKDVYYKGQFGVTQQEIKTQDPNGNNYQKFLNKNTKDESITGYEQNIMLNRNDNLVSAMNYTMRYD